MLFYALFKVDEESNSYIEFYLIGIFDDLETAELMVKQFHNSKYPEDQYLTISRELVIMNMDTPFRDEFPFNYIIEPMRLNQLVKDAEEIATIKYSPKG